jgi:hypothetical protein
LNDYSQRTLVRIQRNCNVDVRKLASALAWAGSNNSNKRRAAMR